MSARLAAVRALDAVLRRGRSLSDALPEQLRTVAEGDRAFAQALAYGVLRHRRRLDALASDLLSKPLRSRDHDVHMALLTGLHQLADLAVAPHAAVAETAELGRALRKPWAVRLLNGTLRRFQRERERRLATIGGDIAIRESLPAWLAGTLRKDWPDDWATVAARNNDHPPMTLRVNRRHAALRDYRRVLAARGIDAAPLTGLPDALILDAACPVEALPEFDRGAASVQDGAAQFAAALLDARDGEHVLDACAAPGGKTAHILEHAPAARLVALDSDDARLERVRENLARLGLTASLQCGDAGDPADWWDGESFDRILLDAPCSATGVIRRHPDIKWLRRGEDIPRLANDQARLLERLWETLATGGTLVYATCSVLRAENEAVIGRFVASRNDVTVIPPSLPAGRPLAAGHQILPGDGGMDGFYYACLRKR